MKLIQSGDSHFIQIQSNCAILEERYRGIFGLRSGAADILKLLGFANFKKEGIARLQLSFGQLAKDSNGQRVEDDFDEPFPAFVQDLADFSRFPELPCCTECERRSFPATCVSTARSNTISNRTNIALS
jgi:hypothetical protein